MVASGQYWLIVISASLLIMLLICLFLVGVIITNRRLRKQQDFLTSVLETATALIWIVDQDGIIRHFNKTCEAVTGCRKSDVVGKNGEFLKSVLGIDFPVPTKAAGKSGAPGANSFETNVTDRNGELRTVSWSYAPLLSGDRQLTIFSGTDITENTKAQKALQDSLKEKELLLREIHHRVKNNLQVISSLLSLQRLNTGSEHAQEMLQASQSRIHSMALTHEKLHSSHDIAMIDLGDYVKSLTDSLCDTYLADTEDIKLQMNVEPIELDIDRAINCGLIMNELISNSFKHAFPEKNGGKVLIEAKKKDDTLIIKISDNGVGYSGIQPGNSESLGLTIVDMLSRQLKAELHSNGDNGVEHILSFTN